MMSPQDVATLLHFARKTASTVPIWFVTAEDWPQIQRQLPKEAVGFLEATAFEPLPGRFALAPAAGGGLGCAVFGLEGAGARNRDPFLPGRLAPLLPAATYRFANRPPDPDLAALAFLLSCYRFQRYRKSDLVLPRLLAPEGVDPARIERLVDSIAFGRDLINTPANDMGPDALEAAATALARGYKARVTVIKGEKLLEQNFPLIFAVGKAAAQAPRLVDFQWGPRTAPKVTLVGKGVCFDTGGLDIKPDAAMLLMKKDMGGAATALSLARMIMDADLPVRLRVLLPIVENAISAQAFRPGDIYPSRKGLTVEIGNTDAEGRLILADALTLACEDTPALLIDFATLTGAARVALGPDLPPFYTDDETLAEAIAAQAVRSHDPVWRLPLWNPYDSWLDGKVSALNNVSGGPFAGSITAALFLRRFVATDIAWAHFDVFAWNPKSLPGRPEGGEIQVARLLSDLIEARFGRK
jgi:leucyl aminopeptidase